MSDDGRDDDGPPARPQDAAKALKLKDEGNKLYKEQKFEEAEAKYTAAIEAEDQNHVHWSNRSGCYIQMTKARISTLNKEALSDAERCVALSPEWPKGYYRMACAQVALKQWDDAEWSFKEGLRLAPDDRMLRLELQSARDAGHKMTEELDKQVSDKEKAEEAKAKGNKAFQAKKFAEAAQEYTLALSYNPTDAVYYSNRCGCRESLAKRDPRKWYDALRDAEKCAEMRPEWAKAHVRKANALLGLGRLKEARAAAKVGLKLEPDNDSLRTVYTAASKGGVDDDEPPAKKQRDGD